MEAIPGFCSCGFIPRPSSGMKSSRVNGFALKQFVAMKKRRTAEIVPVAQGASCGLRRRFVAMAIVPYIERMSAQKSSEPACPLQNAVKMYAPGIVELMWLATYSSEKSFVRSAVHSPIDARRIMANVA